MNKNVGWKWIGCDDWLDNIKAILNEKTGYLWRVAGKFVQCARRRVDSP